MRKTEREGGEKRRIEKLRVKKKEGEKESICMYVHMNRGSKIKEDKTKAEK